MAGGIDIYGSRRTRYEFCKSFRVDESTSITPKQLAHEASPDRTFYAREESPKTSQGNNVQDMMMFDSDTITISTEDDVGEMAARWVIEYAGSVWVVRNVQRKRINKRSEFSEEPQFVTYIQITK